MKELLEIWNSLTYLEGFIFSAWILLMYAGKCAIEKKFK